jgi:16S rRNA (guanine966-N2)-methyltransferase
VTANAALVGVAADVRAQPVSRVLAGPVRAPYDVAFLDPPYPLGEDDLAGVLALLVGGDWIVPGGTVVVERSRRSVEPGWPDGLGTARMKKYGETVLWYVRRAQPRVKES